MDSAVEIRSACSDELLTDFEKKIDMSGERKFVEQWLNRNMRVKITDGRTLVGIFVCTDKDCNLILGSCQEYIDTESEPRTIGLSMIPGQHIVSIDVDDSAPANPPKQEPNKSNVKTDEPISVYDNGPSFHQWSLKLNSPGGAKPVIVHFHVIRYGTSSLYLWVGDERRACTNMSCSMKTPFAGEPTSIELFGAVEGASNDQPSESSMLANDLACKLAKKLNKQVVVSYNTLMVISDQDMFTRAIEQSIFSEIKINKQLF